MARTRTITDEEILSHARALFRSQGHDVSTRQIADSAGISEGVLYQRFGNKNDLFFAAMAPGAPDVNDVLGPETPAEEPKDYLRGVVVRMADYFGEVLPLAIRLITHPSFDRNHLSTGQPAALKLQQGLAERLACFEKEKKMRKSTAGPAAQLLVRLAHDWALARVMSGRNSPKRATELESIVELVWHGAAPRHSGARE
jgi:AcrR family transcriptional regulator